MTVRVQLRSRVMAGKSVQFSFKEASADRVWEAALQAVARSGYSIQHSDATSRVLSFNTGRSMSSWAGQDLSMTLVADGSGGTMMSMGGSLGKGGNPFGGGQAIAWGEKGRLIDKFAVTVKEILPRIPDRAAPQPSPVGGSVADELAKLASLRDSGVITEDEFAAQKAKLLG